jgi:hypothetical protein
LLDRPALKIEMAPHTDPDKDMAALRDAALREKLAPGVAKVDDAELEALVRAAYEKEYGKPKEPPTVEQMETKLLEKQPVGDEALRALSARRAQWVKTYLTAEGRLPAERVTVASAPAGEAATRVSRVDFTLK